MICATFYVREGKGEDILSFLFLLSAVTVKLLATANSSLQFPIILKKKSFSTRTEPKLCLASCLTPARSPAVLVSLPSALREAKSTSAKLNSFYSDFSHGFKGSPTLTFTPCCSSCTQIAMLKPSAKSC